MLLVILIVLLLVFPFGGYRLGGDDRGPVYAGGGLGLALVIILILYLAGVLR